MQNSVIRAVREACVSPGGWGWGTKEEASLEKMVRERFTEKTLGMHLKG